MLRRDPDEADVALRAAEDAGRRSLAELRRTVALLRSDGESAVSTVPGLPRLVDDAWAGGLVVERQAVGDHGRVDPMVGLALYWVAQEALLNAARHAPSTRTIVTTTVGEDRVELRVQSRGPVDGSAARRPGYGLVGMRRRHIDTARALARENLAGPAARYRLSPRVAGRGASAGRDRLGWPGTGPRSRTRSCRTQEQMATRQYPRNVDRARTLTAAVSKDGSWYVARCLEIEVASQGETIDEALVNLREALELYFEDGDVPADFVHPLVTPIEIRIPA